MAGAQHRGNLVKAMLVGDVVGGAAQGCFKSVAIEVSQAGECAGLGGEPPALQRLINQAQRTTLRHGRNHRSIDGSGWFDDKRFGKDIAQLFDRHTAIQPMNGSDAELVFDQLGDVGHGRAGGLSQRCAARLVAKRSRDRITVMPVGDEHWCRRDERGNRANPRGVINSLDPMRHAVVVAKLAEQLTASHERVAQLFTQRQAPHRREVARRCSREVEPISLGFRRGALMRQDRPRTFVYHFECADYANGVALRAARIGEAHAIERERRSRVMCENSAGTPSAQGVRCRNIGVVATRRVVADGQIDGDDVVRVEFGETATIVGAQHVVGRGSDARKIGAWRIAQRSKWQEGRTRSCGWHTTRLAGRWRSTRQLASVMP